MPDGTQAYVLAFARRPERTKIDEAHALDRGFVDFGIIDLADLQVPLIKFVVHRGHDLIQIVPNKVLDVRSRFDRET